MLNLASGFADRGLRVDLVVVAAEGDHLDALPRSVRLVELGVSRTATSPMALRRYVRESGTPVIISALHHANLALLLAKRVFRLPVRVVPTIHNTLSVERKRARSPIVRVQHAFMDACYRWADRIVAVSEGVAADFRRTAGVRDGMVETIYNPVITEAMRAQARERPDHPWFEPHAPDVIVAVGRLVRQKDFATLLRAFARSAAARDARLMILGEGPERPVLERLAAELGIADRVAMPGFVPHPYAFLGHARLYVMSSEWEGLPTALIEALAVGVPIVSTDCPSGPREILRDGAYGRLVPVADPDALAAALSDALAAPRQAAPREAWQPYTWDAAIDAYLRVAEVAPHA